MRYPLFLASILLTASLAIAADQGSHDYTTARATIAQQFSDAKAKLAGNADAWIANGVIADRSSKTVQLFACATGITPSDPVEFFVAPFDSGKDYESLAMTEAKPSDVKKALEFIGLAAGRPADFEKNRQWPRGPRVVMQFDVDGKSIRAEDFIVDSDHKAPLPHTGLAFTGSFTSTDDKGQSHLAADAVDDRPIAPDYNDPAAVLDVPQRSPQSQVYGFQRPSAEHQLKSGESLMITLSPATGAEAVASKDVVIATKVTDGGAAYTLTADQKQMATASDLPHLVNAIAEELDAKQNDAKADWFTTVTLDPAMQVTDVRKLYGVLMALEKDPGIKLDPPAAGGLFHRAFFPDEGWRNRDSRLGEPWELFLTRDGKGFSGRVERVVEADDSAATQPHKLESYPVSTAADFAKTVNAYVSQWSKVIFIYPPADLTEGELMDWVNPVLATYPRVFVFPPVPITAAPITPAAK